MEFDQWAHAKLKSDYFYNELLTRFVHEHVCRSWTSARFPLWMESWSKSRKDILFCERDDNYSMALLDSISMHFPEKVYVPVRESSWVWIVKTDKWSWSQPPRAWDIIFFFIFYSSRTLEQGASGTGLLLQIIQSEKIKWEILRSLQIRYSKKKIGFSLAKYSEFCKIIGC